MSFRIRPSAENRSFDYYYFKKFTTKEREQLRKQNSGPAGGEIYVALDNSHAMEFCRDRPGLKKIVPVEETIPNQEITDTNQWGKPGITQVEYEYSFSDFIYPDELAVYYGYQKSIDYINPSGSNITEIAYKKIYVNFDENRNTVSITCPENTIIGVENGVQKIFNPDSQLTYVKQQSLG